MFSYNAFRICLLALCFACTNASSNATAETDAPPGGKLYLRTMWWAMNNTMEIKWIYLGNDGTIVMLPKHGVNPVNVAEEKKDNKYVGTYKQVGDSLKVTWNDGTKLAWYTQRKGGVYTAINKAPVVVAQPLPAGFRFAQSFPAWTFFENENVMHSIDFKADGTCVFNKYANEASAFADKTVGTYTVNKNTITVSFPGGQKGVACVARWAGTKSLIINTEYQDIE